MPATDARASQQQAAPACTGGQATSLQGQKTQQSPDFGRSTVWQPLHS